VISNKTASLEIGILALPTHFQMVPISIGCAQMLVLLFFYSTFICRSYSSFSYSQSEV
jgi:hypothetical protein